MPPTRSSALADLLTVDRAGKQTLRVIRPRSEKARCRYARLDTGTLRFRSIAPLIVGEGPADVSVYLKADRSNYRARARARASGRSRSPASTPAAASVITEPTHEHDSATTAASISRRFPRPFLSFFFFFCYASLHTFRLAIVLEGILQQSGRRRKPRASPPRPRRKLRV